MVVSRGISELRDLVALCRQRGFVYESAAVHGGFANSFDFGPLGVALKQRLQESWWRRFVTRRSDVFGLDSAVLMPPKVWEHSGHLDNFTDPLVDCKTCQKRFRADHLADMELVNAGALREQPCPCSKLEKWGDEVSEVRTFNLMFETSVGPVVGEGNKAYFRPETAQGAFVNFENVAQSTNARLPFGIAQVGKAFRNEVTPGNYIFRTREFEQMELEWFCNPDEAEKWFDVWLDDAEDWLVNTVGIRPSSIKHVEHAPEDLAHYARRTVDIEFNFPFGWGELWGIANRGTYDLTCHGLHYKDKTNNTKVVPAVIEPALGLSRLVLAVLCDAYRVEEIGVKKNGAKDERQLLALAPSIAPHHVAVLPLVSNNADLAEVARKIFTDIGEQPFGSPVLDMSKTSIGKRYRRQDAVGTPYCATIDFETIEDQCVTVRDRDSMEQVRVPIKEVTTRTPDQLGDLFKDDH
mmetsp:Transcript_4114/g.7869  ORF Transcript_4114/g.7869 Transcript_4114/m.7869 type:complete len:465 (+) Transcript_4114:71-1465(+)